MSPGALAYDDCIFFATDEPVTPPTSTVSPSGRALPIESHLPAIRALCREFGVERLEVFGSAASERFDARHSDVDLIVKFAARPSQCSLAERYVALCEALEALLHRPVDMMTDHPIENPYLNRSIVQTRRTIYESSAAQALA